MARTRTRTFRVVPENTRSWDLFLKDFLAGLEDVEVGEMSDIAGLSVVGRTANTIGSPGAITAGSDGDVLRRSGTALNFGTITSASVSNFDEAAQDAVAAALTNSATIAWTYTDGTNTISGSVLAAGVDHNALLNYLADEHIAHSGVTLTAGAGLTGGGTIAASRTLAVGAGTGITVNADDVALSDMAQSRIKGRAEGAGTGGPTDLTPTQVVAIIDAETPTWTGLHTFSTGSKFIVGTTDLKWNGDNLGLNTGAAAAPFVVCDKASVAGPGFELVPGGTCTFQTYNRTSGAYVALSIDATSIALRPSGTARLTVDSAGRWIGTALHNNASGIAGTTQYVASGTYTPTLTNVANVAASTAYKCQYTRTASVVTVSGKVDVDPTLAATSTQLGISLPVASNLAAAEDCAGTAACPTIAAQSAAILGDAANNRAQMEWISGDITNQPMYFQFTYEVL